jgi:hypothetical protein
MLYKPACNTDCNIVLLIGSNSAVLNLLILQGQMLTTTLCSLCHGLQFCWVSIRQLVQRWPGVVAKRFGLESMMQSCRLSVN